MKVKMKKREHRCLERCKKYKNNNNWDTYIAACDSYQYGFRDALLLASEHVRYSWTNPIYKYKKYEDAIEEMSSNIQNLETDEIEIENGSGD